MGKTNRRYQRIMYGFLSYLLAFTMIFSSFLSIPAMATGTEVNHEDNVEIETNLENEINTPADLEQDIQTDEALADDVEVQRGAEEDTEFETNLEDEIQIQEDDKSDFEFEDGVITKYTGTEKDLVIPDKIGEEIVTGIGKGVFSGKKLNSVIIPNSVDSIGIQAFANNDLTSIELPKDLIELGAGAFFKNQITSVIIPGSLREIGNSAFSQNSLVSVTIEEGVESIGQAAFSKNELQSIKIPDSVTFMAPYAFQNNKLKSVELSKNLKAISKYAFDDNELTSITIPEGITNIDTGAFRDNELSLVTLPESLIRIGEQVFTGNELKSLDIPQNLEIFVWNAFLSNPGEEENIKLYSPQVVEVDFGASQEEVTDKLNENVKTDAAFTEIKYPDEIDHPTKFSTWKIEGYTGEQAGEYTAVGTYKPFSDGPSNANETLEKIKVVVNVVVKEEPEVPEDDYWKRTDFTYEGTTITGFSESGKEKFQENKDVVIPSMTKDGQTVDSIGDNAFELESHGEDGIKSLILSNTIKTIGSMTFRNNNIVNLKLPDSIEELGNGVFASNKDLETLKLSNSLKKIPNGAFSFSKIKKLIIPEGVTEIGGSAFNENRQLSYLSISNTVEEIGSKAFWGANIVNLTIPGNVKKIGQEAFVEGQLSNLILEEGIETIGRRAFKSNELSEVIIPKSITGLDKTAFDNNNNNINLKYTLLIDTLEEAEQVNIEGKPKEKVQALEEAIKAGETVNVKSVATLEEVNTVVEKIQQAIKSLEDKPEFPEDDYWKRLDFTYNGTAITGFSESGKEKFATNKHLVLPTVNELGQPITEIGDNAFTQDFNDRQNPEKGINSVVIPDTVKVIGKEAFRCNCLTEIKIPESVTTIKESAFNGNKLQYLDIPDSVTVLEGGAFTLNEIATLKISKNLTTIETAFGYNKLTTVTIPEGVTKICDLAFSDNQLTEVKLPSTIKYLSGFNNNNFKSIEIPKSVEELGGRAFARNKITSVTIPGNVKVIGEKAFWNTWHDDYLHSVIIEEGVEKIAQGAFTNNDLIDVEIPNSLKELHEKAFSKNVGYDGIVHLYTPNYKNLNNLEESEHHVINPARIIVKYEFDAKVLKEEEIWRNPETREYLHIGDIDIEITPEYKDNEYELKDKSPIKVQLENKENEVVIECKRKEKVENITIKSIGRVAPIVVDYGTGREVAFDRLAKETYIIDSNDKEHKVKLVWTLDKYDGNKTGEYTAIGNFELPAGVVQSEPETKLEVSGKIVVKEKLEFPQDSVWKIEDFIFEGTTLAGFSEQGKMKLNDNKDLVLPNINEEGQKITHIAGEAFKEMELTSVIIPEGLDGLIIGQGAFENNQIAKVLIPEGVREIDTYAFKDNEIRYIEFPGTLIKIGNQTFANNKLISAVFSEDIGQIMIDNYSFLNNQLTKVTIWNEAKKIAPNSFKDNIGYGNDDNKVHIYTLSEENKWFDVSECFRIIMLDVESVEEVEPVEVDFGTAKENIGLPDKVSLNLNNGDKKEVDVTWTSREYHPNKSGEYTFTASYDLPYGMTGKLEISVKVIVKEGTEAPEIPEKPEKPQEPEIPEKPEKPSKSDDIPSKEEEDKNKKQDDSIKKEEKEQPEQPMEKVKFVDADKASWAKEAMEDLASKKIIVGFGNDEFRPNDKLTKAEFATILVRAFNLETANKDSKFADVKSGDWYYKSVMNLASLNIISGDGTGKFNPNGSITREQMIKMLMQAISIKYPEYSNVKGDLTKFKDSSTISNWAMEYMEQAIALGLIQGFEDSTIGPKQDTTRAQAAVLIYRVLELTK